MIVGIEIELSLENEVCGKSGVEWQMKGKLRDDELLWNF
jgi:hypothetical protein